METLHFSSWKALSRGEPKVRLLGSYPGRQAQKRHQQSKASKYEISESHIKMFSE